MESLTKLKQTLSYMIDFHGQLLQLVKEKRDILIEGDLLKLEVILSKESKCTEIIRRLEEERKLQVQQFMLEKGCNPGTVEQLIQIVADPDEKSNLSILRAKLSEIVNEISELNKNNQQLIQMTLSYIQYSMNILMPKEQAVGYGKKLTASSIKFLDAKV